MSYPQFDRSRIAIKPLAQRTHDLTVDSLLPLDPEPVMVDETIATVAQCVVKAQHAGGRTILAMGAHVLRRGVQRHLIDMMERGLIGHVALNGAGAVHDFEFALIGATTESVARYIQTGEFGMWSETGVLNDVAEQAVDLRIGFGEALGKYITENSLPHADISVAAAALRCGVPLTVHVGIGQDIVHQHPNCNGAAVGEASYTDFLVFAESVRMMQDGCFINAGTAVMGPEIFLKALSMARNVEIPAGREVRRFTTAVFDIAAYGDMSGEPDKADPRYYFRPWKTILARTVADGGRSYSVCGDHRETIPALRAACIGQVSRVLGC